MAPREEEKNDIARETYRFPTMLKLSLFCRFFFEFFDFVAIGARRAGRPSLPHKMITICLYNMAIFSPAFSSNFQRETQLKQVSGS